MMIKKLLILLCGLFLIVTPGYANWWSDIFIKLSQLYGLNLDMRNINRDQLEQMRSIASINQSQLTEVRDLKGINQTQNQRLTSILGGLTGTHSYGSQYYDANQYNWGNDASSWQSILALAKNQGSGSALGSVINRLSRDYPTLDSLGAKNDAETQYYRMQAQTTLASRATAQLSFEQMLQAAKTMQQLHAQIDKTQDAKAATDLNNRLAIEQANIGIQQTKLLAILVEQTAIDAQQKSNAAKQTAKFFDA